MWKYLQKNENFPPLQVFLSFHSHDSRVQKRIYRINIKAFP